MTKQYIYATTSDSDSDNVSLETQQEVLDIKTRKATQSKDDYVQNIKEF